MHIITVEPFGKAWRVQNEALDEDMMFQGGAAAEAAARVLADALARRGVRPELQIRLRDGSLIKSPPKARATARSPISHATLLA